MEVNLDFHHFPLNLVLRTFSMFIRGLNLNAYHVKKFCCNLFDIKSYYSWTICTMYSCVTDIYHGLYSCNCQSLSYHRCDSILGYKPDYLMSLLTLIYVLFSPFPSSFTSFNFYPVTTFDVICMIILIIVVVCHPKLSGEVVVNSRTRTSLYSMEIAT